MTEMVLLPPRMEKVCMAVILAAECQAAACRVISRMLFARKSLMDMDWYVMGQCLRASAFGAELRAAERAGEKDLDIRNKWLKENIRKGATLRHPSFAVEPVLP